jgi:4'-phosphopantetheinyl transferase
VHDTTDDPGSGARERRVRWEAVTLAPVLGDDEVHIWRLDVTPGEMAIPSFLAPSERARLDALRSAEQRRRFLSQRIALRRVLAAYLGTEPPRLSFRVRPGGKPVLAEFPRRLEFNLSHSEGLALLAVSRRLPVGVDLEVLRPLRNPERIIERVLGEEEARRLLCVSDEDRSRRFFRLWTGFEARQKALGRGVFGRPVPPDAVHVTYFVPARGFMAAVARQRAGRVPRVRYVVEQAGGHPP